ncbi:hypothetical protein AGMMS50276_06600 [Synergistales bacterium]|nr:hypothetical protein AGMMS50276_06600 [Synergistales bacterium]
MTRVFVKYCGGCNPSYDRVAFVERLGRELKDAEIVYSDSGGSDFVLIVCGCPVKCAAYGSKNAKFIASSQDDFSAALSAIENSTNDIALITRA